MNIYIHSYNIVTVWLSMTDYWVCISTISGQPLFMNIYIHSYNIVTVWLSMTDYWVCISTISGQALFLCISLQNFWITCNDNITIHLTRWIIIMKNSLQKVYDILRFEYFEVATFRN